MKNMLDWIQTIWDYNYWGRDKLWDCVARVSEVDFTRPVPYSMGSIHEQVVHVMWAEALWLGRIQNTGRVDYRPDDFVTREAVMTQWQQVQADWMAYLQKLTEAELGREILVKRLNGEEYIHTVGQILIHVVNHGTDHRAQILRIIHDFGGKTFEQDMIFYWREKGA